MNPIEKTMDLAGNGLHCSQAILAAFGEQFGVGLEEAKKLGRPFGGGMGHLALTCGAISGAIMVLGLAGNNSEEALARKEAFKSVRELVERFEKRHGTSVCKELLGADMSTAAGMQKIREKKLTDRFCPGFIRDTAEILAELLESSD